MHVCCICLVTIIATLCRQVQNVTSARKARTQTSNSLVILIMSWQIAATLTLFAGPEKMLPNCLGYTNISQD